jgi:hypothetical protein
LMIKYVTDYMALKSFWLFICFITPNNYICLTTKTLYYV